MGRIMDRIGSRGLVLAAFLAAAGLAPGAANASSGRPRLASTASSWAPATPPPQYTPIGCDPSMPRAATSTRSLPICRPSIWMISRSSLDKSDAIHLARRSADGATNRREAANFEGPSPAMDRQVTFGKPDSPPEFARLHVDFPAPTKAKSHTFRLRHEILSTPTAAYSSPTTFPICFA